MAAHNLLEDRVILGTSWTGKDNHLAQCRVIGLQEGRRPTSLSRVLVERTQQNQAPKQVCFFFPSLYLQRSGECPVFTVDQKQAGNSRIVQAKRRTGQSLRLARWPANEEDGDLPHEEATSHSLEGVVSHEAHGVVQPAALVGLQCLQPLDLLQQDPFLQSVGKADLGGHLVVVQRQSHARPPGTVALRDGDVPHQAQHSVAHGVEVLAAGPLRDVQGEGQLGGVQRALLLTCSSIHSCAQRGFIAGTRLHSARMPFDCQYSPKQHAAIQTDKDSQMFLRHQTEKD